MHDLRSGNGKNDSRDFDKHYQNPCYEINLSVALHPTWPKSSSFGPLKVEPIWIAILLAPLWETLRFRLQKTDLGIYQKLCRLSQELQWLGRNPYGIHVQGWIGIVPFLCLDGRLSILSLASMTQYVQSHSWPTPFRELFYPEYRLQYRTKLGFTLHSI